MRALSLQDTCLVRHHPIFIAWRVPNNATHRSGKDTSTPSTQSTPGVLAMTPEGDDSSALFGSKVLFLSKRLAMCCPLIPRSTQILYISCQISKILSHQILHDMNLDARLTWCFSVEIWLMWRGSRSTNGGYIFMQIHLSPIIQKVHVDVQVWNHLEI